MIEVEFVESCNLDCFFCENRYSNTYHLSNNKIDCNKLLSFIDNQLLKYKKIYVVLDGGEPTLHPDLYDFCYKLKQRNVNVFLLTNLTANDSLYEQLQLLKNVFIVPTYHDVFPVDLFVKKLKKLKLHNLIIPVTNFICNMKYINDNFNENKIFQYLDDYDIYDKNDIKKINVFLNYNKIQPIYRTYSDSTYKICNINNKHIYVLHNNNIIRCTWVENIIGNINNSYLVKQTLCNKRCLTRYDNLLKLFKFQI